MVNNVNMAHAQIGYYSDTILTPHGGAALAAFGAAPARI